MITELQYQSKETEKLLMKNEKLQRENQVCVCGLRKDNIHTEQYLEESPFLEKDISEGNYLLPNPTVFLPSFVLPSISGTEARPSAKM